jgi:hypothetical protein
MTFELFSAPFTPLGFNARTVSVTSTGLSTVMVLVHSEAVGEVCVCTGWDCVNCTPVTACPVSKSTLPTLTWTWMLGAPVGWEASTTTWHGWPRAGCTGSVPICTEGPIKFVTAAWKVKVS